MPASRQPLPESPHAAERHVRLGAVGRAVDRRHAAAAIARDELLAAVDAGRPDRRGQPVGRVVGEPRAPRRSPSTRCSVVIGPNSSVQAISRLERRVLDQRRRHVEAAVVPGAGEPLAAGEHPRAGVSRALDRGEHVLELALVDHRAEVVARRRARRAGPRVRSSSSVAELVVDRVEDDDPAARRAALAGVRVGRQRRGVGRAPRGRRRRRRRAGSCRRARGRPSPAARRRRGRSSGRPRSSR